MKHDSKTCPDCKMLKEGNSSRSMGFSEDEIDFKVCRRQIDAWEKSENKRRNWNQYH